MNKLFKKRSFWISAFLLALAIIAVYKTFDSLGVIWEFLRMIISLLTPFIIGFAIAFLLYIPTSRLEKVFNKANVGLVRNHAKLFSIFSVYIVIICLITILLSFAIPALVKNLIDLLRGFPDYYNNFVRDYITPNFEEGGFLSVFGNIDIGDYISIESLSSRALEFINMNSVGTVFTKIATIGGGVLTFFIGIIISIYMLADRKHLVKVSKNLLSMMMGERRINSLSHYVSRVVDIFYKYVYSVILDAIVVAFMCIVGLSACRVPYAIVLGTFIGFMNVIPYFGATIGGVAAAVITLFTAGFIPALICGIVILIIQQLDGNLIQPRIVGSQVGIRPIYVIFAVTVGGGLFGFMGILLGVPVMAVLLMIINDLIERKNKKDKAVRFAVAEDKK